MKFSLRLLYLYLFSAVGLIIMVIGCVRLVSLGLKTYVFPDSENYESYPVTAPDGKIASDSAKMDELSRQLNAKQLVRNRQRELAEIISMLIVGLPLYLYHWKTIQKENSNSK